MITDSIDDNRYHRITQEEERCPLPHPGKDGTGSNREQTKKVQCDGAECQYLVNFMRKGDWEGGRKPVTCPDALSKAMSSSHRQEWIRKRYPT